MRKVLLLLILTILVLGCTKPKPKKYVQRIDFSGSSDSDYFPPYETDSLQAFNNTQAYTIAAETRYGDISLNRRMHKT
jgi:hypothetical protein